MTIMRHDPDHLHCEHEDPSRELIHVDCASHTYPDGSVGIHEMCFHVLKDEIVALCGPNGSGKSTLIEHLNGLLLPTKGDIVINGRSVTRGEREGLWKEVGVIFQRSEDQLFAPTVLDDVMFGPLNLGMAPEEARTAALEALEAVGAAELVGKLPNYLSGGQKRLVSIAGILAMKPRIIAMDEPTSDLDPVHSARIERLIVELKTRYGISVVIATHDLELAARIADRICLVRNGAVFAEGSPRDVFYDSDLIHEAGLKQPDTVKTWLEYCRSQGGKRDERPVTRVELVRLLGTGPGR
ncbi:energy-coupling factor ABC transporter ATP-binding protein [Methanoregula formicica]|uniref:ABC-type cobalt transport system, ATPase component n=1 Tax=Methanoregula formicica (strain DSM 22288 / NBRC 105244 / SMSP) TaxID=593750 RepID=L0HIT7_METFS|nr:ATP-binding cassette domain-containing protein [Methanoregula formicica]AGB03671.1 ABC-type cobalt transport system, ATPase component [Methanoregula formicica SMSP]